VRLPAQFQSMEVNSLFGAVCRVVHFVKNPNAKRHHKRAKRRSSTEIIRLCKTAECSSNNLVEQEHVIAAAVSAQRRSAVD
jgi:hypothetical protein